MAKQVVTNLKNLVDQAVDDNVNVQVVTDSITEFTDVTVPAETIAITAHANTKKADYDANTVTKTATFNQNAVEKTAQVQVVADTVLTSVLDASAFADAAEESAFLAEASNQSASTNADITDANVVISNADVVSTTSNRLDVLAMKDLTYQYMLEAMESEQIATDARTVIEMLQKEYPTKADLPAIGNMGVTYIVLEDETRYGLLTGYRWTGSDYTSMFNLVVDGAEIKANYEAMPDTNAYTDAEKAIVDISTLLNTTATTFPSAINENKAVMDTHIASTGEDHTYIDQDVTTTATPLFAGVQVSGGTGTQGTMTWNADEETVDLVMDADVTLQMGQELLARGKNTTGSVIPNGTVVMVTGAVGTSGVMEIQPHNGVKADGYRIAGIATQDIGVGEIGFTLLRGKLRGLDTSMYAEGTQLYVSPAGSGALTDVEPNPDQLKMFVAVVVNSHATNGTLQVRTTGIDEHVTSAEVYVAPAGNLVSTTAQAAFEELQGDVDTLNSDVTTLFADKLDKAGGIVTGALEVQGDFTVSGTTTTVNSTTVTTSDNKIVINEGEAGTGVTAGDAGIEIDRGLAVNYEFKFDEVDDSFKIGETGSLQKVATREDAPIDGGVSVWDETTVKFNTTKDISVDSITVTGTVDGRDISVDGAALDSVFAIVEW